MLSFPENSDEDLVLKQIQKNASYWGSDRCKRSTMEKYVKKKGVENPSEVVDRLIQQGFIIPLKRGYVAVKSSFKGDKTNV